MISFLNTHNGLDGLQFFDASPAENKDVIHIEKMSDRQSVPVQFETRQFVTGQSNRKKTYKGTLYQEWRDKGIGGTLDIHSYLMKKEDKENH